MGSLVSVVRPGELTSILPAKKKISFNHIDKLTKKKRQNVTIYEMENLEEKNEVGWESFSSHPKMPDTMCCRYIYILSIYILM